MIIHGIEFTEDDFINSGFQTFTEYYQDMIYGIYGNRETSEPEYVSSISTDFHKNNGVVSVVSFALLEEDETYNVDDLPGWLVLNL